MNNGKYFRFSLDNNFIEDEKNNIIYTNEKIINKSISLICSNCYTIVGSYRIDFNYNCMIRADKFLDKYLGGDLYWLNQNFNTNLGLTMKCPVCGKKSYCFPVDENMATIIQELNLKGIRTTDSCESHILNNDEFDYPYIAFNNIDDKKYFDMKNSLLKFWKIEDFANGFGIYLSDNATIEYIFSNKYIEDLELYIKEYIK